MNITEARAAGKKVLALIDGKSVFYRGYYAMPNLTTADGRPTGGVYGFAVLAIELINRIQPDYVAVAWDKRGTNIRRRRELYAGYKANRHKAPDDFYEQIPILQQLLDAFGWPMYEADDYEADDIMGTLAQEAGRQNIHTILISSDLDLLQLIDDDTEVYAMKKGLGNLEKFDVSAFTEKYGLNVDQFLDLKSLKGDASDNIPGVAGVGEKTAANLLRQYGTLDGVYENIDNIGGAMQKKLIAGRDSAYLSRQLAEIWCNAPTPLDLTAMDINNLDRQKLNQVLRDLQFTSLIKRLPDNLQLGGEVELAVDDQSQKTIIPEVKVISDVTALQSSGPLSVAVLNGQAIVADESNQAVIVEIGDLAPIVAGRRIVADDIKSLCHDIMAVGGVVDFAVEFDIHHASFLINSLQTITLLAEQVALTGGIVEQLTTLIGVVIQRYHDLAAQLAQLEKLDQLARNVDFPLQIVLAKIEARGVAVDVAVLDEMSIDLNNEIDQLADNIWGQAGVKFNIASPKQLSEVLFDTLKIPPVSKKNKSGYYPTGAKELSKIADQHPVVRLVGQYRELAKLKSTYVDALPTYVTSDGRIHTTFDQDVAATGRLSSSNPNLQNIPARTERGRMIKRAFVASSGKVLVNADYAQFELRLAAALAGDQKLIDMFANPDYDIHTLTAAEAYDVTPAEVTDTQRRHAKVINFGVLYGMSPHGLSEATGMSVGEAKQFIDRYFTVRKPIRDYIDQTLHQAETDGYVSTYFGRRRPTPDIKSSNFMVREAAKRAAANMPIQGTEADLMKMAMLAVEGVAGASQLLQVHDSIMVECDPAEVERVASELKQIMENIYPDIGVRLLVDVKIGASWADL